ANFPVHLCVLQEATAENAGVHGPGEDRKEKVPSPHLSQLVVLTNSGTLYGLAQRVVATESLVFLAEQFESLQSHLDTMMPAAKKPFLQQFYSQTVATASELRKPIYWIVAAKAIDYEQMLLMMAGVKWDIREIMSQHNVYVDVLLKEFEQFNKRLGDVSRHVRIPLPVSNVLWEHCIRLANRTLVEGLCECSKICNSEYQQEVHAEIEALDRIRKSRSPTVADLKSEALEMGIPEEYFEMMPGTTSVLIWTQYTLIAVTNIQYPLCHQFRVVRVAPVQVFTVAVVVVHEGGYFGDGGGCAKGDEKTEPLGSSLWH
ncbi:hypothetical protein INR49_023602, partial [Caranx melampygus]